MKKKILLFVSLVSLGFLFCFGLTQVSADDGTPAPETQETTQDETPATDELTEVTTKVTSLIDYLKSFTADDLKGWITGIIAYLSANLVVIVGMCIKILLDYKKKLEMSEAYQKAIANMTAEQKNKIEQLGNDYTNKLNELYAQVVKFAKTEDSQNRARIIESAQAQSKEMAAIVEELKNSTNN